MKRSAPFGQLLTALLLAISAAAADAGNLPLWELEGGTGRIILMGSVHFLRASDYPLPAAMESAYAAADTLVMEIDMDDVDPLTAQTVLMEMGSSRTGETLQDALGSDYRQASELADQLGIPLAMFDAFEPWFAASDDFAAPHGADGFRPGLGNRTADDGKSSPRRQAHQPAWKHSRISLRSWTNWMQKARNCFCCSHSKMPQQLRRKPTP